MANVCAIAFQQRRRGFDDSTERREPEEPKAKNKLQKKTKGSKFVFSLLATLYGAQKRDFLLIFAKKLGDPNAFRVCKGKHSGIGTSRVGGQRGRMVSKKNYLS